MLRSTIARQEPCAIDRRSFPTLDELDRLLARENDAGQPWRSSVRRAK
jgi:hypothetical protein